MAFISLGYTMEPPALQRACCARRRPGNGREGARGAGEGFWGVREDARAGGTGARPRPRTKARSRGRLPMGRAPARGRPARGTTCPSTRSRIRRSVGRAAPVRRRSGPSRKRAATRRREGGRPIFIRPAGMAGKNCPISVQPAGQGGAPGQRPFYNMLIKKDKAMLVRPLLYPGQQRHRPGQARRPATATGTAPTRYTVPYRLLPQGGPPCTRSLFPPSAPAPQPHGLPAASAGDRARRSGRQPDGPPPSPNLLPPSRLSPRGRAGVKIYRPSSFILLLKQTLPGRLVPPSEPAGSPGPGTAFHTRSPVRENPWTRPRAASRLRYRYRPRNGSSPCHEASKR